MTTKKTRSKPKTKPAKPAAKDVGGRPTKYIPAYAEQARKLALLGMTDKEMAEFFMVSESTLNNFKKVHPEFLESLKAGKEGADIEVAASLYRAAIGGGTILETREEVDTDGNVITKKTVKELPANVTAQIFFLKNRQPRHWRDKIVVEDETPPDTLADTAAIFETIMAKARERQRQVLIARGILKPQDGD